MGWGGGEGHFCRRCLDEHVFANIAKNSFGKFGRIGNNIGPMPINLGAVIRKAKRIRRADLGGPQACETPRLQLRQIGMKTGVPPPLPTLCEGRKKSRSEAHTVALASGVRSYSGTHQDPFYSFWLIQWHWPRCNLRCWKHWGDISVSLGQFNMGLAGCPPLLCTVVELAARHSENPPFDLLIARILPLRQYPGVLAAAVAPKC